MGFFKKITCMVPTGFAAPTAEFEIFWHPVHQGAKNWLFFLTHPTTVFLQNSFNLLKIGKLFALCLIININPLQFFKDTAVRFKSIINKVLRIKGLNK